MIQTPTVLKRNKIYIVTPKRSLYLIVLKGKPSQTFRVNIVGKYLAQESNLSITMALENPFPSMTTLSMYVNTSP